MVDLCKDILKLLTKTQEGIFGIFDEHDYDAAFFDLNISLQVKVDDIELKVSEGWDALEDR